MPRKFAGMICTPTFFEEDDDGEPASFTYHLTNPQTGQPISFNVPANEWKKGWDWNAAIEAVDAQLAAFAAQQNGNPGNGVPARQRDRSLQRAKNKPRPKAAAKK